MNLSCQIINHSFAGPVRCHRIRAYPNAPNQRAHGHGFPRPVSRLLEQRQSRLGKQRRSNGVDIDVLFDIVDLHSCYSTECFPIGDPRVGDDVV